MAEVRLIKNLKGILYYLDTPLLDFEIRDRRLIKAIDLNDGKLFPPELAAPAQLLRDHGPQNHPEGREKGGYAAELCSPAHAG